MNHPSGPRATARPFTRTVPRILLSLVLGVVLVPSTTGGPALAGDFDVTTVNNDKVWEPSLAVGAEGDAHVAYYYAQGYSYGLDYRRRIGGAWGPEEVVSGFTVSGISLALDPAGEPHLAFFENNFAGQVPTYASRVNGTWQLEPIAGSAEQSYGSMSLAFDGDGRPHVAYSWHDAELVHAVRVDGHWVTDVIDPDIGTADPYDNPGVSLRIDSHGAPWVSYHRGATLLAAHATGEPWTIEPVDGVAGLYVKTSLALDSHDQPFIAYFDGVNSDLRFAYKQSGQWVWEVADPGGMVGGYPSLVVDPAGDPHISYVDADLRSLKYAHRASGGAWIIATVDDRPGSGNESSLALDVLGRPQIAFKFKAPYSGPGALRYASLAQSTVAGVGGASVGRDVWMAPPRPNPSIGGSSVFEVHLPAADRVRLEVDDLSGRLIAVRAPQSLPAGSHRLAWDSGVRQPGVYFVRLRTDSGADAARRWVVVR